MLSTDMDVMGTSAVAGLQPEHLLGLYCVKITAYQHKVTVGYAAISLIRHRFFPYRAGRLPH